VYFIAPRRQALPDQIRNPKLEIQNKPKAKNRNPKRADLEFGLFLSFRFVSNFGFRVFTLLLISWRSLPFDLAQGWCVYRTTPWRESLRPGCGFAARRFVVNSECIAHLAIRMHPTYNP
jgi:hypothetical protein